MCLGITVRRTPFKRTQSKLSPLNPNGNFIGFETESYTTQYNWEVLNCKTSKVPKQVIPTPKRSSVTI